MAEEKARHRAELFGEIDGEETPAEPETQREDKKPQAQPAKA
jgi:hypothetical protein